MVKTLNCALKTFLFCANQCKTTKENDMCFGGGSKPAEEKEKEAEAIVDDRIEAENEKREEVEKVSEKKREDIGEAIESRTEKRGARGGSGRRSLFRSGGGGYLGRFG